MKKHLPCTLLTAALGLAVFSGPVAADKITNKDQAVKVATSGYPGEVLSVNPIKFEKGDKYINKYVVEVKSGVYSRQVVVNAESGEVDAIYYWKNGNLAWTAEKQPIIVTTVSESAEKTPAAEKVTGPVTTENAQLLAKAKYPGRVVSCVGPHDYGDGKSYRMLIRSGNALQIVDVRISDGTVSRATTVSVPSKPLPRR